MSAPLRELTVDWGFYGGGRTTLTVRLFPEERAGLAVGDQVVLVGDETVAPRQAEIVALSAAGRDAELRLTDG